MISFREAIKKVLPFDDKKLGSYDNPEVTATRASSSYLNYVNNYNRWIGPIESFKDLLREAIKYGSIGQEAAAQFLKDIESGVAGKPNEYGRNIFAQRRDSHEPEEKIEFSRPSIAAVPEVDAAGNDVSFEVIKMSDSYQKLAALKSVFGLEQFKRILEVVASESLISDNPQDSGARDSARLLLKEQNQRADLAA